MTTIENVRRVADGAVASTHAPRFRNLLTWEGGALTLAVMRAFVDATTAMPDDTVVQVEHHDDQRDGTSVKLSVETAITADTGTGSRGRVTY